ncbi:hypothetical protein BDQ17DRAFT_1335699 [Cyathus striatus]|nr:hypothetical protein BDQ17DRAFT_1335699 [Cyathus striatus]
MHPSNHSAPKTPVDRDATKALQDLAGVTPLSPNAEWEMAMSDWDPSPTPMRTPPLPLPKHSFVKGHKGGSPGRKTFKVLMSPHSVMLSSSRVPDPTPASSGVTNSSTPAAFLTAGLLGRSHPPAPVTPEVVTPRPCIVTPVDNLSYEQMVQNLLVSDLDDSMDVDMLPGMSSEADESEKEESMVEEDAPAPVAVVPEEDEESTSSKADEEDELADDSGSYQPNSGSCAVSSDSPHRSARPSVSKKTAATLSKGLVTLSKTCSSKSASVTPHKTTKATCRQEDLPHITTGTPLRSECLYESLEEALTALGTENCVACDAHSLDCAGEAGANTTGVRCQFCKHFQGSQCSHQVLPPVAAFQTALAHSAGLASIPGIAKLGCAIDAVDLACHTSSLCYSIDFMKCTRYRVTMVQQLHTYVKRCSFAHLMATGFFHDDYTVKEFEELVELAKFIDSASLPSIAEVSRLEGALQQALSHELAATNQSLGGFIIPAANTQVVPPAFYDDTLLEFQADTFPSLVPFGRAYEIMEDGSKVTVPGAGRLF